VFGGGRYMLFEEHVQFQIKKCFFMGLEMWSTTLKSWQSGPSHLCGFPSGVQLVVWATLGCGQTVYSLRLLIKLPLDYICQWLLLNRTLTELRPSAQVLNKLLDRISSLQIYKKLQAHFSFAQTKTTCHASEHCTNTYKYGCNKLKTQTE
jgi:hypothetical protein